MATVKQGCWPNCSSQTFKRVSWEAVEIYDDGTGWQESDVKDHSIADRYECYGCGRDLSGKIHFKGVKVGDPFFSYFLKAGVFYARPEVDRDKGRLAKRLHINTHIMGYNFP